MTLLFLFHLHSRFCLGSLLVFAFLISISLEKRFFSFPLFISMTIREKRLYLAQSKPISTPPPHQGRDCDEKLSHNRSVLFSS